MANLTNPFQATAFPTMNKNFLGNAFTPTDTSWDSKSFPWLTVNEENEIFSACDNANMTQYERNLLANDLYKKKIEQKNSEKKNQEKAAAHLELVNKAAITTDPKTKNSLNNTARKHEVADMIRNYVMNANGKDLTDVDDWQLIHDFSQENQQAAMAIDEFINGNESSSYFSKKMWFSQQDEEKEQSWFEQWLTWLGDRFQAFWRWVDNLLSKGQSAVDESWVDLNAYTKYIQDKYWVSYPAKLDKATRDKEYATVKENPELLKPYMTSTSDDVLDVAEWGVDIAFSSFNPYATAAFTTAWGLESLMGWGALTWFWEKMWGIWSVINELPWLSQFRDSLSEENQARFDQFVANSALWLMLWVKNKSNIYKNPKQFLVENLQPNQITKNFMENVVGISEKAYSWIQRAWNFARGIEWGSLSKMASRMTNGLDWLSEWWAEKLTKTSSAQDKLYKAQEPRMNVLSEKKNLEQRRANSDRANQLIVENWYKPTNTSERLQAHDATLKKLWNDVLTEVNKWEWVFADQSSIINALDEYIKNQKELWIDASKADIKALEWELNAMKKQQAKWELDFPTLEKKKQVYNDLIDWKGTEASEVYKKWIKLITSEIGKLEDAMLSEIPWEFSQLKRDVWALIDTYEDVFKADMKNQRKKWLWLTETYSRLEGISDTLWGIFQLFKWDVSWVAKWLSKVALGKAMAKATDVDFLVKKWFEELSKSFEENQVSSKTAPKIQEGIKTDQAVFDELSNYILDVNKEYSAEDISALWEMIDKSRKSLSREDYQTLKDALREQIQNRDLAIEEAEWLRTEGKAIEMWEDIKAVKEFQKRILEIEEQEKNIGKVAWKKVNRTYADQQMRAWESKREKLIKELEEYYDIDQYEAAAKYDELLERANINDFRKDSNRWKYQVADNAESEYEAAVKNWDEARAKEILKEYAEKNWYIERNNDYKMSHRAPSASVDKADFRNIDEIAKLNEESWDINLYSIAHWVNKTDPEYFWPNWARLWRWEWADESFRAVRAAIADMENQIKEYWEVKNVPKVKVYRAVPDYSKRIKKLQKDLDLYQSWSNWEKENGKKSFRLQDLSKEWLENYDFFVEQVRKWYWDMNAHERLAEYLQDRIDEYNRYSVKEWMFESWWDWVTPSKHYADMHGKNTLEWNYKIISEEVPADELRWDGNDINEWGFDDGNNTAIKKWVKNSRKELEITYDDKGKLIPLSKRFDESKKDSRFQKYWTAWEWEKWVNAIQWLNIRNFKNWKSVKELANNYWIKTHIVDSISTPEWQKAYGMYWDKVITLARDLKESTVPHELLHATFDMVDSAKRTKILEGIQKRLKVDDVQAEEWLADNFSEYYRTGKFDTKAVPTTLAWQIKQFFQQIKEFIDWTYANRKEIQNLFDDIIDGKLEWEYWYYSDPRFQTVWHWSHAIFDKFDSSHMWEWEGAQAHGWGHYVAVDENTSRRYAWLKSWIEKPYEYDWKTYKEMINERNKYSNIYESRKLSEIISLIDEWENSWGKSLNEVLENRKKFINKILENDKKTLANKSKWTEQYVIDNLNQFIENDEELLWILDEIDVNKINKIELPKNKHLYEVDIPDPIKKDTPTGSNYFEEWDTISSKAWKKIADKLREKWHAPQDDIFWRSEESLNRLLWDIERWEDWRAVYEDIAVYLWWQKQASKFLESLWYDGIHYFWGRDWECYVIFNDDSLEMKNREDF